MAGKSKAGAAHMTWARSRVGRSLSTASLFLRRRLWVWPIIAVVVFSFVNIFVFRAINSTIRSGVSSQLEGTLEMQVAMLEQWYDRQIANAEGLANSSTVREAALSLVAADTAEESGTEAPEKASPKTDAALLRARLQRELAPWLSTHDFVNFALADKEGVVVAANQTELLGKTPDEAQRAFLLGAIKGHSTVSPPFKSTSAIKNADGVLQYGVPTMFVVAPVRDASFQIIAALALRIRPESKFTEILQTGHIGETGETYAVDRHGVMVSNSRFDADLILAGILPESDDTASILNVRIVDPGGDVISGHRPGKRRSELPLNLMAKSLTAGESGLNVEGYRDYRGVPVVGAWRWLPEHNLGIVSEMDYTEAYRPLTILRWAFSFLVVLLMLTSAAIFGFTVVVARLDRQAREAAIEARQLGQYQLDEKLGAGAMGVVYKGRHAMLRRATAIKLLDADKTTPAAIERFEREVQLTCQLNHPNTIAIFDFGHTPEGVFYYAMEFLDGISLQDLVDKYGPLPEERVIHILLQVCGSLYEAHSLGLVHRDIKPANIMLNRRGATPDLVKVLDFGLVKARDDMKALESTRDNAMLGTPLYMSPEAIENPARVDARSDIYAVGAVGYFLLTGETVFNASSLPDLFRQHVSETPKPPSLRTGRTFSPELENAILSCLEKSPARRPQTARDLALRLERCRERILWTTDRADDWWDRHARGLPQLPLANAPRSYGQTASESLAAPTAGGVVPPNQHAETFIAPPAAEDETG